VDKTCIAQKIDNDHVAVPVSQAFIQHFPSSSDRHLFKDIKFSFSHVNLQKKHSRSRPSDDLFSAVKLLCINKSVWHDGLESDFPRTWEKHGDMLLLPSGSFLQPVWLLLGKSFFVIGCTVLFFSAVHQVFPLSVKLKFLNHLIL